MNSAIRKNLKNFALGLTIALGFAATAHAQRSSGGIMGEAVTGDTVTVVGVDTGFHREITVEKDGKYTVRTLPTGTYSVTVKSADGTQKLQQLVAVRVGTNTRIK